MVIIFYDANEEQLHICTETEKTRIISINDPDVMSYIPNDDILYVEKGHFITKHQFHNWLKGDNDIIPQSEDQEVSRFQGFLDDGPQKTSAPQPTLPGSTSRFIHPRHNGTLIIHDMKSDKYPDGVMLSGKWDFVNINEIGGIEALEQSSNFKWLEKKGRIEIVDAEYVKQNIHKKTKKVSPAEAALDAILVPHWKSAKDASSDGGLSSSDIPEIFVE